MEKALKEGRLGDVLEEAKGIPQGATAPIDGWLEKVRARHGVDQTMARVEEQLKASLLGAQPGTAPAATDHN
jgi:hypothetical protein